MNKGLFTVFLIMMCVRLAAQSPTYSFVHINRAQGLASNDVYDICQDQKGFYWICTDNGLQRYDGKRWVGAESGNHPFLPDRPVKQAVVAGVNRLLLKFGDKYGIYNTASFTLKIIASDKGCKHPNESFLWQNKKGQIFTICRHEGLSVYDSATQSFKVSSIRVPANFGASCIYEDTLNGRYWIGGRNGIVVFDERANRLYTSSQNPYGLPLLDISANDVSAIFIDGHRNYWLVQGSLQQSCIFYSEKEGRYIDQSDQIKQAYKGHFKLENFFYSREAGLWIYGKNALVNYMPEQKFYQNNKSDGITQIGARFGTVRRMFQDAEKGVWVATDNGIYEFYTSLPPVRSMILKIENGDNSVTDVEEVGEGRLWITRFGKSIRAIDTLARKIDISGLSQNLSPSQLRSLNKPLALHYSRRTANIWILCEDGHLLITDTTLKNKKVLKPGSWNGVPASAIAEDISGNVWMALKDGRIFYYDVLTALHEDNFQLIDNLSTGIIKMVADNYSSLWVCTSERGLLEIDINGKKRKRHFYNDPKIEHPITSNTVKTVVRLNDSILMVATDMLNVLNLRNGAVRKITFKDGLAGNSINGMEADSQGNLWIATSNGMCRYNYVRDKFTVYGEKDGFIDFENIGASSKRLSNDHMLFAGSNLLVLFPPREMNEPIAPPQVLITDIKVADSFIRVERSSDDELRLPYTNNSIAFYFSAMSYLQKDKLIYYYRLHDLDNEWINAGQQMGAVYSQLPSGNYVFEVRCENEEGESSAITKYALTIQPPFWKTWWFITVIVLFTVAILYLFYRLKVKRIIALSELRERVARDLHDDVGSTLSTISILSEIAKGKLSEDTAQTEKYISRISENSQQMMEAMDDIVWSIKPMNDSMQKIIARMREVTSAALEPKNIDIDFYVDEGVPEIKLNMESRRDLFLIFKEAINNVAKYSGCTHVGIHLAYSDRNLELKIRDNGIGFDIESADSGNGISNMKKRAAMLGGSIRWYSEKDQGTQVQLIIPIK